MKRSDNLVELLLIANTILWVWKPMAKHDRSTNNSDVFQKFSEIPFARAAKQFQEMTLTSVRPLTTSRAGAGQAGLIARIVGAQEIHASKSTSTTNAKTVGGSSLFVQAQSLNVLIFLCDHGYTRCTGLSRAESVSPVRSFQEI